LKKVSLIFGALLALALINVFSRVPLEPTPSHLAPRYEKASFSETRIASPNMAILGDYRGFDLVVAACLFGVCGLVIFLSGPKAQGGSSALFVILGVGGALALGLFELGLGDNYLDHEALARWVGPLEARWKGVFWLSWAAGLALLGVFLAALRAKGPGEGSRGA
jgi:hypothetical protein